MQAVFLYNPEVVQFNYGTDHPFRLERLWLTESICRSLGLFNSGAAQISTFAPAERDALLSAHDSAYLDALEDGSDGLMRPDFPSFGLGYGDNPVFPGLWQYCLQTAGGSLAAAELLASGGGERVFHPGGGLHHAMARRAAGFCYVNDVVLAIERLTRGGQRVFYLDIDAHHGDGVQMAFYDRADVLTCSIHQDGRTLFPGSGFPAEAGAGAGAGYSVNVPLMPYMSDGDYHRVFDELVDPLLGAYRPHYIVTELGADALQGDPLAALNLSLRGWWQLLERIAAWNLPWLAVGGGGYDLGNALRAWSLAWIAMVGAPEPTDLPRPTQPLPGTAAHMAWPPDFWSAPGRSAGRSLDEDIIDGILAVVKAQIFPSHGL